MAFATGGQVDIGDHHSTCALAQPFDSLFLAAAIRWVLEYSQRLRQLGAVARQRAQRLWHLVRIPGLYAEVYGEAMEDRFTLKRAESAAPIAESSCATRL